MNGWTEALMPAEAAAWIYSTVLTRRYLESVGAIMWTGAGANRRDEGQGPAFLALCDCRYGLCGRCSGGRPDLCAHRNWSPGISAETYIVSPRGYALARVWRSGRPCRWLCPSVRVGQLELFALAGGAR
jgi:hypothetical protein